MARFRIIEAKYEGTVPSPCVADWLADLVRDDRARIVRGGQRVGDDAWTAQGAKSYIWGVEQLKDWVVVRCDTGRIGDWDGVSPIPELDGGSGMGPRPYTRLDAVEDAVLSTAGVAGSIASGIGDKVAGGLNLLGDIALPVLLLVGAVWLSGGKSSGR